MTRDGDIMKVIRLKSACQLLFNIEENCNNLLSMLKPWLPGSVPCLASAAPYLPLSFKGVP